MNQLEQLKQEVKELDINGIGVSMTKTIVLEIIENACLVGRQLERERCLEIIEYKFPYSQENQNIINLINSKE